MNRKSVTKYTSSAWVLHKIDASYETDEDNDERYISDEEYHGNYTFIVIEEDKKKCKTSNIRNNLQMENFEDE